jgi:hypothetical protein
MSGALRQGCRSGGRSAGGAGSVDVDGARSLADRAVEIGPRRAGADWLVPEVDAQAAIQHEQALAQRVADLEDQLEDFAIAVLLEERLAHTSGQRVSLDELAAQLGLSDLLAKQRARQEAA